MPPNLSFSIFQVKQENSIPCHTSDQNFANTSDQIHVFLSFNIQSSTGVPDISRTYYSQPPNDVVPLHSRALSEFKKLSETLLVVPANLFLSLLAVFILFLFLQDRLFQVRLFLCWIWGSLGLGFS